MRRLFLLPLALLGVFAVVLAPAPHRFTIDDLVAIKHPSNQQWTPDGKRVWWVYDDAGINNVWTAPADGKGTPVALTRYPEGQTGAGGFWSRDGGTFFFSRDGGLLAVAASGGDPQTAWASAAHASGFQVSPDGTRVGFLSGQTAAGRGRGRGGAASTDAADATLIVHTFAGNADLTLQQGAVGGYSWSPDGSKLAFTRPAAGGGGDLVLVNMPDGKQSVVIHRDGNITTVAFTPDGSHLTFAVAAANPVPAPAAATGTAARGQIQTIRPEIGNKLVFITNTGGGGGGGAGGGRGQGSFLIGLDGGAPQSISGAGGGRGGGNWLDATHQLQTRTSNNGKTRTYEAVDISGGPARTLHEETEDKFFSAVNTTVSAVSSDHRWLLYTSDASGWDQVYIVPTGGGAPIQVTTEPGDHWRAVWSHDSRHIAWDTNTQAAPGDRQIQIATLGEGAPALITVTAGAGTNTAPQWSPDDTQLLYQHTDAQNSADLYVAAAAADAKPVRLTNSMPAAIDKSTLVAPKLVHYPGPDGKPVPAWLFVPRNLDPSRRHAAIVWIHPDGVNQNYDGWHTDRNEAVYYEFHQYLLQQGYVVIAPDYRGSIGYGRDWRNDVYMDVGGNDAKDARMAAGYLKTLGYVDANRIGVWGLSYGGFFVLQAVTQEPTLFAAAVDVAGVTDYALYYEDPYHGSWTTSRIGTPEENPEVYAKAEPMRHVDQVQRPLLILAGTADVNVPFIESALLVDALLKAGKGDLVTFMMYPGEFHYFDRGFVVRDAWQRVDRFFAGNLHPDLATAR